MATVSSDQITPIPIDQLLLDPANPRLPFADEGRSVSQAEIIEFMLREGAIQELMGSIGEMGFKSSEPLLVTKVKEGDPDWVSHSRPLYYVVEGNRRLTAALLLKDPQSAPIRKVSVEGISRGAKHHPAQLPVLEFAERSDLLDYIGYRHITGTKPWGALEKAIYLSQLRAKHPTSTFSELAKIIGSRADYVAKLLTALAIYKTIEREDFFDLPGVDRRSVSFSLITTALGYSGLLGFLGLDSARDFELRGLNVGNLRRLTGWMFEQNAEGKTRLGESRNLGDLSTVVEEPKALEAFEAGRPLTDALLFTGAPTQVYREAVAEAHQKLKDANNYVTQAQGLIRVDAEVLGDIRSLARDLLAIVNNRLLEEED